MCVCARVSVRLFVCVCESVCERARVRVSVLARVSVCVSVCARARVRE